MLPRVIPALIVAALTISACGGDGKDKAAATPTPAPAWVAAANDACTESQQKVAALGPEVIKEEQDPAKAAALVVERSVPIQQAMFAKLRQVDVPADLETDYGDWVETLESSLDLFPRLVEALRKGKDDPTLTKTAAELVKAVQPFADEHGLTPCVQRAEIK
jgi:hypothetical protein